MQAITEKKIKRPVGRPRVANKKPRYSVYTDSSKFTHIQVSKNVHQELTKFKEELGSASVNDVIHWLIESRKADLSE